MKKKRNKIAVGRTVLLVVIALIIGFGIYNWNAKKLAGNQMPMPFGIGVTVVLSGSMEPTLYKNDLVFIHDTGDYDINDVVVYQDGNSLVIHRIVDKDGENITTCGDNNQTADTPIAADRIKGEMLFSLSGIGVIVKIIQQPVVVVAVLLAALYLAERSFRKEKSESADELRDLRREIELLKDNRDSSESDSIDIHKE